MKRGRMKAAVRATGRAARKGSDRAAPTVQKGIDYLRANPDAVARGARKVAPRLGRYGGAVLRAGDLATAALKAMGTVDRNKDERGR